MIKFVYFDLGGVVIEDFSGTNKFDLLMKELGLREERFEEFDTWFSAFEKEICKGKEVDSLLPEIQQKFGIIIPNDYSFLIDGFVSKFRKNTSIWETIVKIKNTVSVGLLTNAYPNMLEEIVKLKILPEIAWDVVINSSREKVAKPEPKIFEIAQQKAGFSGQEILLVDNSLKNVKAGSEFGWQTYFYDSKDYQKSSTDLWQYFENNVN